MSFLPALLGDTAFRPKHAMINTTGGFWVDQEADFALRKGKWKLIIITQREDRLEERFLFNIEEDLGEENNLIEEYPDLAEELETLLERVKVCGTKYLNWN